MPWCTRFSSTVLFLSTLLTAITSTAGAEPAANQDAAVKRIPWTTSRVIGTPEPPDPYTTENAFPGVKFNEPLELIAVPGTNRLAVAERSGKIYTFANDAKVEQADLLVDVGRMTYGMAFHPLFAENGYLYVTSILDREVLTPRGTRVTRYQLAQRDPPRVDPASETIIFEWPNGAHNGGCLRFGPDGYLYISTGDGSGIADQNQYAQDISDLRGAVLRIDVNRHVGNQRYAVPEDNPLVNVAGARGEIWAFGLRQSWRISFDPATGNLWAGEVGQDLWESLYLIRKGGNYGWSIVEGGRPFQPLRKRGPGEIVPPVLTHSHSAFRSITGGYFYHGSRLPELQGAYLYGDYDTGKVWLMRYDGRLAEGKRVTENRQLADTQLRIVAFGQDGAGEVYLLDYIGGGIHRLKPAPPETDAPEFPRRLSETGLFASTSDHQPAAGLIPYSVNAPLWSDGSEKERFLALPGMSQIEFDTVTYPQPSPGAPPGWRFPDGTVLVKTFSLDMEAGNPASRRRLETRLLHFKQMPGNDDVGAQFWRGYTYIWNDEQTDALLADDAGAERTFTIRDADAPEGHRQQKWRFPSRTECALCHTFSAKYALGVNTLQMNREHDYGHGNVNQLEMLDRLGVFTRPLPKPAAELPKLVDHRDPDQPIERRARAYLHSNCAHCHRKWGGGNADFQLLWTLPVEQLGVAHVRPAHGEFKLDGAKLLAPGEPDRSLLLHRMQIMGLGRMPHIASNRRDDEAIKLVRQWIEQLPKPGE